MNKLVCLPIVVLFAVLLGACVKATPQPAEGMINPGDKIGDFLITTGDGREVSYAFDWNTRCTDQGDHVAYTCEHLVGRNINITSGLYDDTIHSSTPTARLEQLWSTFNYKLSIEGRIVNLEAFGYIEARHPVLGMMRFWNVVITTDKPGKITIQDSGVAGDDSFEGVTKWNFREP